MRAEGRFVSNTGYIPANYIPGPSSKVEQIGCPGKQHFLFKTVKHNSLNDLSVLIFCLNKAANLLLLNNFFHCINMKNFGKYVY